MGAVRISFNWLVVIVLVVILPYVLSSTMSFGYTLLTIVSLLHTFALGMVAHAHQRNALIFGLILSVLNLIALMLWHDVSALHAVMICH